MNHKKNLMLFGLFSITLIILSLICYLIPSVKIEINGPKNIVVNINDSYEDYGANAYFETRFTSRQIDVVSSGDIDTSKIGKYVITYKSEYNGFKNEAIRIVEVVDMVPPELYVSNVKMCKSNNLVSFDATASDNYDGDISNNIKYKVNDNKIVFYVEDSFGNVSTLEKDVEYNDSEKPILELNNSKNLYLKIGEKYVEYGAKSSDSCDGNLSDKIAISGNVDTLNEGEYTVTYKVVDSGGNESTISRKVIVYKNDNEPLSNNNVVTNGVIYLTFDDGPGPYTLDILNTLDKYDIKATFFVTNQFGNQTYLSYIKTEYEKGHTVGIHTYSHKWSIYESLDTYLDDFNKIHEIVVAETGVVPKYFRFPGGTSNHQAKVSMKKLTEVMTAKGYTYFDWHIDCGDTHGKKATKEYIINTVKTYLKGNGEYIILMHDIKKNTRDALSEIIEYAKERGYKFKKIDDSTPLKQFKPYN